MVLMVLPLHWIVTLSSLLVAHSVGVERVCLSHSQHHHHHHHIHCHLIYTLPVSKTTCLLQTQHQPQIFPCPIKLLFFSYSTRLTRISKWSFKVEDCFFSIALRLLLQKPKACDLLLKSKVKVEDHALKSSQRKTRGKVAPACSQISQACHIWALDQ